MSRPTWNPQPPKEGTKGFDRVIKRGCGAKRDYWGEFDCSHEYDWACDYCPIVVAQHSNTAGEQVVTFRELTLTMNTLNKQTETTKEN